MNYVRRLVHTLTIWHIRIAVLGILVAFVGVGALVLVNAVASDSGLLNVNVGAYDQQGRMADGNWTYPGACAVDKTQFPFGTIIALYNRDGSFNRQCTAEDTSESIGYNSIALAMPGDHTGALRWGARTLLAQIVRWGWGSATPPGPISVPLSPHMLLPIQPPRQQRHSQAS